MISSMTGYGRGEVTEEQITAVAEVRSVNSRYFEVTSKLPRTMSLRENEVKELLRAKFVRGKINVVLSITHENTNEVPLKINTTAAKSFYKLLNDLRKAVKIQEKIKLEHLLNFPEVIEINEFEKGDEREWLIAKESLNKALDEVVLMRRHEGGELLNDLLQRIKRIDEMIDQIETISRDRLPEERKRLEERVKELVNDQSVIDSNRLELEFALMVDKLDTTEECVRFRSHNKYFVKSFYNEEAAGRKLNFLTQEMNREANTIGAKANNAEIAHLVIVIKEELEKIREQLQNIE
ncbi:MAG: YicC/YloC family endoribonuclease [Bacteroidota bacterium]|nr:YicC/YloC family endoribonuclease [Bacteroidota bacterium]